MNIHPILFSGAMVRAILDGRKTQTRRIMKPQPIEDPQGYLTWKDRRNLEAGAFVADAGWWLDCPYGQPGDRLWVRETWKQQPDGTIEYRADRDWLQRWSAPLYMPRAASRITLELTSVRVERLQDISEADAQAEGVDLLPCTYVGRCNSNSCPRHGRLDRYRLAYAALWNTINGKTYPWDGNPWVWVLSFKRVEVNDADR